jgi:hypothetical protein
LLACLPPLKQWLCKENAASRRSFPCNDQACGKIPL